MILGMSTAAFTQFHVLLSLIGIAAGFLVAFAMLGARRLPELTAVFLLATMATSVTGFMFHFTSFGPPEIVGVISLLVLSVAIVTLYSLKLFHALAPTQTELPFIVAQGVVLIAFVALGIAAARKYHPAALVRPLA